MRCCRRRHNRCRVHRGRCFHSTPCLIVCLQCFLRNKDRRRFACPPMSVFYVPIVRRRLRYARSLSSLHSWINVKIIVFWVIGPHESFKKYDFSRRIYTCTLLKTDCLGQNGKSSNNPAYKASRGVVSDRLVLYWYGHTE